MPDRVSVPAETEIVSPPVPPIAPAKVPPFDSVSVLAPSETVPLPDRLTIEVPPVSAEISNVPLSATPLDAAIEPCPTAPVSPRN